MTALRVSAVIPTYNYGRFVLDALASVLAQDYPDLEIIVVDDGSTDDTRQRLAPFRERIRYLYQENQGLSAARNTGIRAAQGDIIALLDADDAWHPRKLEIQVAHLNRHPHLGLLGTGLVQDLSQGWPAILEPASGQVVPCLLEELVMKTRFAPSSALIRRECFDRVGFFDTSLKSAEDRDMWIRIACQYPAARLDLPLCWYRIHSGNMSHVAERMETNELKVLNQAFASIKSLGGKRWFKRKVYSFAAYNAAYMYGASRCWLRALRRALWSLFLWPWPYGRDEESQSYARLKMVAVIILRMLGLKAPEQRGAESPSAALFPVRQPEEDNSEFNNRLLPASSNSGTVTEPADRRPGCGAALPGTK